VGRNYIRNTISSGMIRNLKFTNESREGASHDHPPAFARTLS